MWKRKRFIEKGIATKKLTYLILIIALFTTLCYAHDKVYQWNDSKLYSDELYGRYVTVEGSIVNTYNSGKACFLNFHTNWKKYFTAVIFRSDFSEFPSSPERYYKNKKVRVLGILKEYKGKPEIILKDQSQIKIIERKAKSLSSDYVPSVAAARASSKTNRNDPIVYVTRTGKCYHRGSCGYLRKSKIPMKLSEARKRYRPCSRCRPPQ